MSNRIFLYPIWIRLWHVFNALLCLVLIVTGVSMQYSSPQNAIVAFGVAVDFHNICGILLTINYAIFLIGNAITPNGKFYILKFKGFIERLMKQAMYYSFGIFKGEKAPFPVTEKRKFNPLQQFTYLMIMYFGVPLVILSGWLMLYPTAVLPLLTGLNGIMITDIIHVIMGFFITIFLVIHVYFCTIGHTPVSNFKSMVNGWHDVHE